MSAFEKVFSSSDHMTVLAKFLKPKELASVISTSSKVNKSPYYTETREVVQFEDRVMAPKTVKVAYKSMKVNNLDHIDKIPSSVTSLTYQPHYREVINDIIVPPNVKKLSIYGHYMFDKPHCKISDSIEDLEIFGKTLTHLRTVEFPENLRKLKIHVTNDYDVRGVVFPPSLEELHLSDGLLSYNLSTTRGLDNLKVLTFPKTHFFGPREDDEMTVPETVEVLGLPPFYSRDFRTFQYPPQLKDLSVQLLPGSFITDIDNLPESLEVLSISGNIRGGQLDLRQVAPNLKSLIMTDHFGSKFPILPDGLETLIIETDYTSDIIKPTLLPPTLKTFKVMGHCKLDLSDVKFPENCTVAIGHDDEFFDTKLFRCKGMVLPPSIQELKLNIANCIDSEHLVFPSLLRKLILKVDTIDVSSFSSFSQLKHLEIKGSVIRGTNHLPISLEYLSLDLHQTNLDISFLTNLHTFVGNYNTTRLGYLTFPSNLQTLKIKSDILLGSLQQEQLPPSLKDLSIEFIHIENPFITSSDILPNNLKRLSILVNKNDEDDQSLLDKATIDYHLLPKSLEHLECFNLTPLHEDFARTLPLLKSFNSRSHLVCRDTIFPPNIEELTIAIKDATETVSLPANLKRLTIISNEFNKLLKFNRSLDLLMVTGGEFNYVQDLLDNIEHITTLKIHANPHWISWDTLVIRNVTHLYSTFDNEINENNNPFYFIEAPLKTLRYESYDATLNLNIPETIEVLELPNYEGSIRRFRDLPKLRKLEVYHYSDDDYKNSGLRPGILITTPGGYINNITQ